ncbi:MAG TPA: Ku protein [bacterium]|jgi:DNA end-binding protein Ku|nr:Ku protein [bacterium]
MARPIWKGYLTFGLVTIPIRLLTAEDPKDIRFRLLHQPCGTPIQNRRWCPTHEAIVPYEETVRGFEVTRGRFVVLTDEELDRGTPEGGPALDIAQFIQLEEIDPIFFDKSYYVAPDEGGAKAYHLLREAMRESGKIAVGKVVIREKEHLVAVRPYSDGGMVMSTLFYADEIRALETEEVPAARIHPNERKMAVQLIEGLSDGFQPETFTDTYREKIMAAIKAKEAGEAVTAAPGPRPEKVVDLMDALRRSLEQARTPKAQPQAPAARRGASRPAAAAAMRERHR